MWENACFLRVLISTRLEEQADESYPSKFQFLTIKCATFVPPLYMSFIYNLDLSNSYIWRNTCLACSGTSWCGLHDMPSSGEEKWINEAPLTPSALEGIKTSSYHALLEILHMGKESHYLAKDDPSLKTAIRTIPCVVSFVLGGANMRAGLRWHVDPMPSNFRYTIFIKKYINWMR